ncbi:peptidylprolyl isomerase [Shewanella marina]|uniref:peptidylprolyl isomerase n=1 Tax=Shewanella marina TaxID=487319 RepID=UPI000AE5D44B|nr:peptidyl-prolyl cis-trans isomerase [Shewanella marina]
MDTDVPQKRPQPTEIEMPMISVNGVFIDETVLANELQYHPHDDFERVIQQAGQSLVIKMLLQQKAEACGCDMSAGEESAISLLLQQQVTYQVPTEEDCLRYYENNRATFTTEPLLALDHILLPAAIDEPIEREQARQTAVRLIEMLLDDITLFATLAQQHSACPSKQVGGALGK